MYAYCTYRAKLPTHVPILANMHIICYEISHITPSQPRTRRNPSAECPHKFRFHRPIRDSVKNHRIIITTALYCTTL